VKTIGSTSATFFAASRGSRSTPSKVGTSSLLPPGSGWGVRKPADTVGIESPAQ